MNKKISLLVIGALVLSLAAFREMSRPSRANGQAGPAADVIYVNGKIITVDSSNSIAQAIAVKDGRILAVGASKEVLALKGTGTVIVDLHGKTMLPGFVDGHSHFMGLGHGKYADLQAPPVGHVRNIPDIIATLQALKEKNNIKDGEWVTGFGYDQDQLEERRHPTKRDLDAAFPNNPVLITNVNGHMAVANSYALRISGIDSTTKDPANGAIVRFPGTREPAGLLQEHAIALLKRGNRQKPSWDEIKQEIDDQQQLYASYGLTTAQEGFTSLQNVDILQKAAAEGDLYIDIESLPGAPYLDKLLADTVKYRFNVLDHHLKLAGTKLIADGSPQGETAYFTQPYQVPVPGCTGDDCRGFPNVTQEQFNDIVLKDFSHNIHSFAHCNGDATIDMYIKAVENANQVLHTTSVGRRTTIIHSQFVRADQLDQYKELGMLPSFFTNHTFFWGDVHVRNLGKERAYFESPTKAALQRGIIFTNHTDFGVTPINQLFLLWTSVVRQSRSGQIIGPDQRLTPIEGIRAITINGAYEYFEEKNKGSLEKGKLADLIILSDDPTTVDPQKIKDIVVLETIKEGKTIYERPANNSTSAN